MTKSDRRRARATELEAQYSAQREICGACGQEFDTLEEVFAHECDGLSERTYTRSETQRSDNVDAPERHDGAGRSSGRDDRATDKQLAFLEKLLAERHPELGDTGSRCEAEGIRFDHLTKRTASEHIDHLLEQRSASRPANPASEKQVAFLKKLTEERGIELENKSWSRAEASQLIDALLKQPQPERVRGESVRLEDAIYQVDGEVRKVYRTQAGHQVAKVWDGSGWEYVGKRGLKDLTPEHRMTLEQATEFGAVYGRCCNCGRQLTDEISIEAGIGPICAARFAA